MDTATGDKSARRIRPWIAALLTFLGWGVGLFYARQTRAALNLALGSVLFGVMLGAGLVTYAAVTSQLPVSFFPSNAGWSTLDSIQWALTALVAVWVWRQAAKQQHVERAGAVRLLGYVGIFLLPLLLALVLAMSLRIGLVQPFRIPSGAMQPTLQVGDYVIVSKGSYGYSRFSAAPLEGFLPAGRLFPKQPARGDLVVFRPPPDPDRDFIKRLIGLPGERIQMIDGIVYIDGAPVERQALGATNDCPGSDGVANAAAYRETLPNGVTYVTCDKGVTELDNTREFVVPEGSYFLMGDDRDNSDDSRRSVGYVPLDNLIGRVDYIVGGPRSAQPDQVQRTQS